MSAGLADETLTNTMRLLGAFMEELTPEQCRRIAANLRSLGDDKFAEQAAVTLDTLADATEAG